MSIIDKTSIHTRIKELTGQKMRSLTGYNKSKVETLTVEK